MIVTAFSDTHGLHDKISLPKSDLLIFAGDCMTCGYKEHELLYFLKWFHNQDAEHKIMIAGNHDRYIENYRPLFKEMLNSFPSIVYLENEGTVINDINIWGTPDSKEFCKWAFNKPEDKLEKIFSQIPDDVEILVSHAPQYGTLDQLENGESVGEKTLSNQFNRLKDIRYHIFGHIHCGYGRLNTNYTSLNVSVVNEQYQLQNNPVTFKIYPHG